jgi:hypothetical protein
MSIVDRVALVFFAISLVLLAAAAFVHFFAAQTPGIPN